MADNNQSKFTFGEHTLSIVPLLIAGVAVFMLWGVIVPWVTLVLADTFETLVLVVGLVVFVGIIATFWEPAYLWWMNKVRAIRRMVIADDPVGIIVQAINRLQHKINEVGGILAELGGSIRDLVNGIQEAKDKRDEAIRMMKEAQRVGNKLQEGVQAQHAKTYDDAINKMTPQATFLKQQLDALTKARDFCQANLEMCEAQKDSIDLVLQSSKKGAQVSKKLRKFMGTSPEMKLIEEAAHEAMHQTDVNLEAVDQFLKQIQPDVDSADLKKQADINAAIEQFSQFVVAKGEPQLLTAGATQPALISNGATKEKVTR